MWTNLTIYIEFCTSFVALGDENMEDPFASDASVQFRVLLVGTSLSRPVFSVNPQYVMYFRLCGRRRFPTGLMGPPMAP